MTTDHAVLSRPPAALTLIVTLLVALLPAAAGAQALPGLSSLRVAYSTRKATTKPEGDLKTQIDAVDKEIAAAVRSGDIGEARRQLARGMALLAGTAWTPALDNIDANRIYLIGHSMGAIGTWYLGAKYPDLWAGLGPFPGAGVKGIPQIVVHGDADSTVNVAGSRAMVAQMKRLGVEVVYIEVPGGSHTDVVVPNLPRVFEFLAAHRKGDGPR